MTEVTCSTKDHWLTSFMLPSRWEADVEEGLRKQTLNPSQKNSMVRQVCSAIMGHTETANASERNHIALALIVKYPFLKGSFGTGYQVWAKKIEERILNVKRKASRNIKKKLLEEGAQVQKSKPGRKRKNGSSAEVPPVPPEETLDSLEEHRKQLISVFDVKPVNVHRVRELMNITYPLRRKSILLENARVWQVLKNYPCMQDNKGNEIKAELSRILARNDLTKDMREIWANKKTMILGALKKCNVQEVQTTLMLLDDCDPSEEQEMENRCIFASLPFAVGEKKTGQHSVGDSFWQIINDDSDVDTSGIISRCTTPRLLSTGTIDELTSLLVIGEGMVITNVKPISIFNAVMVLCACFYTFNCVYPKGLPRNIYAFLDYFLLQKKEPLPIGVENFLSLLE